MADEAVKLASNAVQPTKRSYHLSMRRREAIFGYLFLLPWLVGFVSLLLGPMLASIYLSLTNYKMISAPVWIGLANYDRMFSDRLMWQSLKVTATFTLFAVPLGLISAMCVAVLLNQKIFASGVFRTVFYLPSVISGVAVALVFAWIFNFRFGILNYFLSIAGIQGPNWLGNPRYVLDSLYDDEPVGYRCQCGYLSGRAAKRAGCTARSSHH